MPKEHDIDSALTVCLEKKPTCIGPKFKILSIVRFQKIKNIISEEVYMKNRISTELWKDGNGLNRLGITEKWNKNLTLKK